MKSNYINSYSPEPCLIFQHDENRLTMKVKRAKLACVLCLETMVELREVCDVAEAIVPANLWTLATYKVFDTTVVFVMGIGNSTTGLIFHLCLFFRVGAFLHLLCLVL